MRGTRRGPGGPGAVALGLGLVAAIGLTAVAAPVANADSFVQCAFSTAKPYIYSADGVDYVGTRLDASNCRTNLPVTPLQIQMVMTASGAPRGSMEMGNSNIYRAVYDVRDGDSFSIVFPNDGRQIPAHRGVLGVKASVSSTLPGFRDTRFFDYQCSSWQIPGYECTPAVRG